jgi:glutamate mutase epsilon subunit
MGKFSIRSGLLTMMITISVCIFFLSNNPASAQGSNPKKFEEYRAAIQKEFGIDIKNFKGVLKGGRADGKDLTKYDLKQILLGIKVELEHTADRMIALEITSDHLEEIPDYYTRLLKMEDEAEAAMKKSEKKNPTPPKRPYP